jgi:hypothetical protein
MIHVEADFSEERQWLWQIRDWPPHEVLHSIIKYLTILAQARADILVARKHDLSYFWASNGWFAFSLTMTRSLRPLRDPKLSSSASGCFSSCHKLPQSPKQARVTSAGASTGTQKPPLQAMGCPVHIRSCLPGSVSASRRQLLAHGWHSFE